MTSAARRSEGESVGMSIASAGAGKLVGKALGPLAELVARRVDGAFDDVGKAAAEGLKEGLSGAQKVIDDEAAAQFGRSGTVG